MVGSYSPFLDALKHNKNVLHHKTFSTNTKNFTLIAPWVSACPPAFVIANVRFGSEGV